MHERRDRSVLDVGYAVVSFITFVSCVKGQERIMAE